MWQMTHVMTKWHFQEHRQQVSLEYMCTFRNKPNNVRFVCYNPTLKEVSKYKDLYALYFHNRTFRILFIYITYIIKECKSLWKQEILITIVCDTRLKWSTVYKILTTKMNFSPIPLLEDKKYNTIQYKIN